MLGASVYDEHLVIFGVCIQDLRKGILRQEVSKVFPERLTLAFLDTLHYETVVGVTTDRRRNCFSVLCCDEHEQFVMAPSHKQLHKVLVVS
ncbi:MAG: Uncharacterised protein [Porticoccaceae bacterium UBA1117]|nr:MAG: Uncharacterised protein [Porticoccaceae bacterium UBA1117]